MIVKEFYRKRRDGKKLFLIIDAVVDENGEPIRDENGNLVPTGFKILQNETGEPYDKAIDVETAPYTYSETNEPIEET